MTRKQSHVLSGQVPNVSLGALFYKATLKHPETTRTDLPPMPEWAVRAEMVDGILTFYGEEDE